MHYKKKKKKTAVQVWWVEEEEGREKVTLAAKCPRFNHNQINGYLAVKNKVEGMLP